MNWKRVELRNYCSLITKGTTPTSLGLSFSTAGIGFLRVQNLQNRSVNLTDTLYIDEQTDRELKRSRIVPQDVLISIAGTIGRVSLVPENSPSLNCNQAIAIVRPTEHLDRKYLLHWLSSPDAQKQILASKVTGTISNLSLNEVGNLQISVPPLPEQKRIAAILDEVVALRRKRREAIAKLDVLLQSVFLDMFGDPVTNPKNWHLLTLGELAKDKGCIVDGPFGSSLKPDAYVPSGIRVIRNFNIQDDQFDGSEYKYVTPAKFDEISRSEVVTNDILISTKGTVGNVCLMPGVPGKSVLSASGTVRMRLTDDTVVRREFLVSQMVRPTFKQYIKSFQSGSIQKYLNLSGIRQITVIAPPIQLQDQYCEFKNRLQNMHLEMFNGIRKLEVLLAALNHEIFNGTPLETAQTERLVQPCLTLDF